MTISFMVTQKKRGLNACILLFKDADALNATNYPLNYSKLYKLHVDFRILLADLINA